MSKSQNRKDFPEMAKVIDIFRKRFSGLKVQYVRENGKEVGKR